MPNKEHLKFSNSTFPPRYPNKGAAKFCLRANNTAFMGENKEILAHIVAPPGPWRALEMRKHCAKKRPIQFARQKNGAKPARQHCDAHTRNSSQPTVNNMRGGRAYRLPLSRC